MPPSAATKILSLFWHFDGSVRKRMRKVYVSANANANNGALLGQRQSQEESKKGNSEFHAIFVVNSNNIKVR